MAVEHRVIDAPEVCSVLVVVGGTDSDVPVALDRGGTLAPDDTGLDSVGPAGAVVLVPLDVTVVEFSGTLGCVGRLDPDATMLGLLDARGRPEVQETRGRLAIAMIITSRTNRRMLATTFLR